MDLQVVENGFILQSHIVHLDGAVETQNLVFNDLSHVKTRIRDFYNNVFRSLSYGETERRDTVNAEVRRDTDDSSKPGEELRNTSTSDARF